MARIRFKCFGPELDISRIRKCLERVCIKVKSVGENCFVVYYKDLKLKIENENGKDYFASTMVNWKNWDNVIKYPVLMAMCIVVLTNNKLQTSLSTWEDEFGAPVFFNSVWVVRIAALFGLCICGVMAVKMIIHKNEKKESEIKSFVEAINKELSKPIAEIVDNQNNNPSEM